MAAAAAQSLATDTVPCPENPPTLKEGYRKEIFEKEEDQHKFSCGFCCKILRNPVQADCGHRFCENCQKAVEERINKGEEVLCDLCQEEGMSREESRVDPKQMFPDRGFKREMLNIRTKCPNDTCDWHGPFREYVKHEDECRHQPLVCEKCRKYVSKLKMDQHKNHECPQRVVQCENCHVDVVFDQKKNHDKECPKFPETCTQCNKNIPRDKMRKHQKQDCPNRMVTCPIEGCSGPQPQNRFPQHVQKDQVKHLTWALSHIADFEEALNALTEATAGSQASAGAAQQGPEGQETIDRFREKLEQLERQVQDIIQRGGVSSLAVGGTAGAVAGAVGGDPGQASGGGGAEASATTGSTAERVQSMEFKVNSLEPILSVLHGEMNRCIGAIEAVEQKVQREATQARELQQKIEQYESTIAAMSSSLSQREAKLREMEVRLSNLAQDQPDGTLLWRIQNFGQLRRDAVSGTTTNIHSRPFFTGPLGYKMCVRLYPNGDGMGKGSHLSLFFSIMRSNYDALLPWPFKQKVYFMLVDQTNKKHLVDAFRSEPSSSSFQKPTSEMNIATGCPMFVPLNKLTDPNFGYLKDDTLYIRVVVETLGLEDHLKQFDPRSTPVQ